MSHRGLWYSFGRIEIFFYFTRLQTTKQTLDIVDVDSYIFYWILFLTFPDFLIQLNGFNKEENAESGQRDGERRVQVREVGEGAEQNQRERGQSGGAGQVHPEEDPANRVSLRRGHGGFVQPDHQAGGDGEESGKRREPGKIILQTSDMEAAKCI